VPFLVPARTAHRFGGFVVIEVILPPVVFEAPVVVEEQKQRND
jgi:hypothetical protein